VVFIKGVSESLEDYCFPVMMDVNATLNAKILTAETTRELELVPLI
jgi:hypothetical protein